MLTRSFGKKFITEELISKLTNIFAGLAIFICCIGLAGLASFTIEKRIREIGIRKVLGATVQQLLILISKEFLKLVLIAFVIAVPLTWWFMNNWLDKYTYRINISIWLFGIVGAIVLLLNIDSSEFKHNKSGDRESCEELKNGIKCEWSMVNSECFTDAKSPDCTTDDSQLTKN